MALPNYDDIHLPLLKLIHNTTIISVKDAVIILEKEFNLSDEDLDVKVKSGVNKFYSQVNFSRKRLVDAGLIDKNKKPYQTTEMARKILESKPTKISNRDINLLIKKRKEQGLLKEKTTSNLSRIDNIYDKILQKLKQTIDPNFFEYISGVLLTRVYNVDQENLEITPPINDYGIDGYIQLDNEIKIYYQSKLWSKPIGRPDIQKFVGALEGLGGSRGYFFTTSNYSTGAKKYIANIKHDITLIDGHKLIEMIVKLKTEN